MDRLAIAQIAVTALFALIAGMVGPSIWRSVRAGISAARRIMAELKESE